MRDLMPELFALLAAEPEPAVRVVLGHFFFVYVHPYMSALEQASVRRDIVPFTRYLAARLAASAQL